jgi:hypothetical protein
MLHLAVDIGDQRPTAHLLQLVPRTSANVSVIEPAGQRRHAFAELLENLPAAQAVHLVALGSRSVCDPAGQIAQAELDVLLKRPEAHAVQLVPRTPDRVSVAEPRGQTAHVALDPPLNLPTAQPRQLAEPSLARPGSHDKHAPAESRLPGQPLNSSSHGALLRLPSEQLLWR